MSNHEVTLEDVIKIGLIVFVISGVMQFFLSIFLSFLILVFIGLTFVLTISGAFLGKYLDKTLMGVWGGAIFGTMIGQAVCFFFLLRALLFFWGSA